MKKTLSILLCACSGLLYADNLVDIYQYTLANNATYLAAQSTYKAARYGLPLAAANFLPSLNMVANTTANHQNPGPTNYFNSNGYTFTLTQPLLNIASWYGYSEAEATYKQAALTYAIAFQSLILNTASAYFAVLEAEDQLQYAEANRANLKEQMNQSEEQYKVGLNALADVQAVNASYQSANADEISAENALAAAQENLAALMGKPTPTLVPLKADFPLIKPDPQNVDLWVQFGLKNNLALQAAVFQSEIAHLGIHVDATTGFLPTINAVGTSVNNKNALGSETGQQAALNQRVKTTTVGLQASWNIFNGGADYAAVKQDEYNYQAVKATEDQTRLNTETNIRTAYLTVLSDISQVQAYQQAVISGRASLKAVKAEYSVGTETIVNVLTQQSNLFDSEQQYAKAIYSYINDSLTLKQQVGTLSAQDLVAINGWLNNALISSGNS